MSIRTKVLSYNIRTKVLSYMSRPDPITTMELLKGLLNLIYPPRCLICGKLLEDNDGLCPKCFQGIEIIKHPCCNICGKPLQPESFIGIDDPVCFDCRKRKFFFNYARSIGKYKGILKECIHLLKYKGKKVLLKPLDKLIKTCLDELIPFEKISFITQVPLHKKRLRERGFNQSGLIAGLIGNRYQIPVLSNLLNRIVYTPPQATLTKVERLRNIKGVFAVVGTPSWVECGTILLIDDVYTTGATVNECAKVLKKAGAQEVYVLTLAHGI